MELELHREFLKETGRQSLVTPIDWKQPAAGRHRPLGQGRQSLVTPIDWKLCKNFVLCHLLVHDGRQSLVTPIDWKLPRYMRI